MNIEEERKAFEAIHRNARVLRGAIFKDGEYVALSLFDESSKELAAQLNYGWSMWQAAKANEAKKLEGCVVVPKDQIETWWQDTEEPENFATQLNDLHFIADHIEDGDIMEINEHHTVHLQSSTKFGAWVCQSGQRKFIVGTKDDVEAAVKENMAMLEVQEFFEEAARGGNE